MLFRDIPGQAESKEFLSGLITDDRIPHAILFTGPQGNGKLAFALAFAAALLCEEKDGIEVCGECTHCIKSLKYIHPDLHLSFPVSSKEGKKREATTSTDFLVPFRSFLSEHIYSGIDAWAKYISADNKPININVAECNQIIKSLGLRKYEGRYKVQIIYGAEYLSKEGNRLLKLIEEPTPDTIIILISDFQEQLLNTIKSRCQIFKIPPFRDEDIDVFLEDKVLDKKQREETVRLAAGNLKMAIEIHQNEESEYDEILLDIFRGAYTSNITKMLKLADRLSQMNKKEMEGFCVYTLHFLKEYMRVVHLNATDAVRLSGKEKSTALKMTRSISVDMAIAIASLMEENIKNINRNANKKILWTSTMFGIEEIFAKNKIAS